MLFILKGSAQFFFFFHHLLKDMLFHSLMSFFLLLNTKVDILNNVCNQT